MGGGGEQPDWAAQIYWFLNPFEVVINLLNLWPNATITTSDFEIPGWIGNANNDEYHKHFRLVREGDIPKIENVEPRDVSVSGDRFDIHNIQATLDQEFSKYSGGAELWARWFPQPKRTNLWASKLWNDIENNGGQLITPGVFSQLHEVKLDDMLFKSNELEAFYVYADLQINKKLQDHSEGRAITHLRSLGGLKKRLECNSLRVAMPVFVICSFFADGIPDFAVFFLAKNSLVESDKKYLANVAQGLQQLVYDERKAFLNRWINNLRSRKVNLEKYFENDGEKEKHSEEIAKSIAHMMACLAYRAASGDSFDAMIDAIKNKINNPKDREGIRSDLIEDFIYDNGDDKEPLRKKFLLDFCNNAVFAVINLIRAGNISSLKGSLSIETTKLLAVAAENRCERLLLVGDPGGGKGAAAENFHMFRMVNLVRQNGEDKWLKHIKDNLLSASKFGQERLVDIINAQTHNWTVSITSNGDKCGTPYSTSDPTIFSGLPSWGDKINGIVDTDNKDIKGYLIKLAWKIYEIKMLSTSLNCSTTELLKATSFNFLQIACGTLSGNGAPLLASLDRLFGQAFGASDSEPGLFQICSYLGGTLFLDEVADAPVAIQDNLLMALQERKVARRGRESIPEDVSNIVVVSATHKDLRQEVKRFRGSIATEHPVGFRPDLLTRLAQFPPVEVRPVSEYFVYDDGVASNSDPDYDRRARYRKEFISIFKEGEDDSFWERVYDSVDRHIGQLSHAQRFSGINPIIRRKKIASSLSMRLFQALKTIRVHNEHGSKADEFIFDEYLPDMIDYLADTE
ncbi:MAG: sigma 54-interacting transcriptional regulator [Pseudomonadota bacterium]